MSDYPALEIALIESLIGRPNEVWGEADRKWRQFGSDRWRAGFGPIAHNGGWGTVHILLCTAAQVPFVHLADLYPRATEGGWGRPMTFARLLEHLRDPAYLQIHGLPPLDEES